MGIGAIVDIEIEGVDGLLAFIAYNYLHTRVEKTANQMEVAAADFLDILQEPTR
jgi:biopolymer transport protein ExbB